MRSGEPYRPPDAQEAAARWGADSGPSALAAALRCPLRDVFDAVADPPRGGELPGLESPCFRGSMGPRRMANAVRSKDALLVKTWTAPTPELLCQAMGNPRRVWHDHAVLVSLLWKGPWVGTRDEHRSRRWVTFLRVDEDIMVYDVKARDRNAWGGWKTISEWEAGAVPEIVLKRGTGTMVITWAAAVQPSP